MLRVCAGTQVLVSEQEKREQAKLTVLGIWQEMVCNLLAEFTISVLTFAVFFSLSVTHFSRALRGRVTPLH